MTFNARFMKSSRTDHSLYPLTTSMVRNNDLWERDTSVVLDLNVLSKMRKVMFEGVTLRDSGLEELVSFLNAHSVCLVPGLAFSEAANDHVESLHQAYEKFLARHCPRYTYTQNSLHNYASLGVGGNFWELDEGHKLLLSPGYLAMLAIQIISKEDQNESPERKFKAYLDYLDMEVNFLPGIEIEVAKYCFFDRTELANENLRTRYRVIRDNFKKGGKGRVRLRHTLNCARDLFYYRSIAHEDGQQLDGRVQDMWFVTGDQGLYELAKTVYFYPYEGEGAKGFKHYRYSEQEISRYWRYCDKVSDSLLKKRSGQQIADTHEISESIRKLEDKVMVQWPEEQ